MKTEKQILGILSELRLFSGRMCKTLMQPQCATLTVDAINSAHAGFVLLLCFSTKQTLFMPMHMFSWRTNIMPVFLYFLSLWGAGTYPSCLEDRGSCQFIAEHRTQR